MPGRETIQYPWPDQAPQSITLTGTMPSAAFFDLDKTIIAKSSTLAFTRPLYRAGYLKGATMAKAGLAQAYYQAFGADHDQLERIRDELAALTKGWHREEVQALIEDSADDVLSPLAYAEALAIIAEHRGAGRRVVVISSSPEEIVRPICAHLSINEVIATRAEVDEEGRYTGEIELFAYGPAKAQAMIEMAQANNLDLDESYAYSDSMTDLPMLEAVGHPVAVNPDKDLLAVATERDWEIRWFESAVTLRDRVDTARVPATAVLGGLAAALAYRMIKRRKS